MTRKRSSDILTDKEVIFSGKFFPRLFLEFFLQIGGIA